MARRSDAIRVVALTPDRLDAGAALMANEHRAADRAAVTNFSDENVCHEALSGLLSNEFEGFAALIDGELVGLICLGAFPPVGFVPAHGLAIRPCDDDPTSIVVALLAQVTPRLLDVGVLRITVDHVVSDGAARALHEAGFGGGSVFAIRDTTAMPVADTSLDIRIGTNVDLDSIADLSHIELEQRYQAPSHGFEPHRSRAQTREIHAAILDNRGTHLIASLDGRDVGLLTIENESPAPRLCPDGAFIGPTATRREARGHGVGKALVAAALDEARARGHRHLSVDFESTNPLARPFWLGLDFTPTGYRLRRVIRIS